MYDRVFSKWFPSDVIQSFCSAFWTEEKKWWFVADCPYNNADTIELYSQSPPSHDKVIFCPAAFWASNSVNPNFKSVRTLGLQTSTDQMWFIRGKSRYFSNATTIRPPPTPSGWSCWNDKSTLSNYINLTVVKKFIIEDESLTEALPLMASLTTLKFRHLWKTLEYFKKISSPIHQLKNLILATSWTANYCLNQSELSRIHYLFLNLEYLELAISQLDDLTILINELIHLTYMNGHFACGSTSEQQIQQWMEKHDAMDKLRWSLEKDRLGIWLY
ncbi:unnamed protein product [Rotaria sp. Silwood1]|nr:unnamed protein product [Rotaria sp. Silwood1]